ncbi:DUF4167 domain-containing protein, partial [Caulobacter sp. 17J80-11]|nr:DUF4167 domain-containing protein [Caulobacter sp. 17J80-11]
RDQPREARDPLAVIEPKGAPAPAGEPAPALAAREDDHLPAFLRQPTPAPAPAAEETAEKRPRARRKRPASFDQGDGEAPKATAAADEEA